MVPIYIHNQTAIITSRSGKIVAIGRTNGRERWSFQTRKGIGDIMGGAVAYGNSLYFGSNDRCLYALNSEFNGTQRWKYRALGFIQATPLVDRACVYFGTTKLGGYSGNLYCLKRKTGKELWKYKGSKGSILVSPVRWRNLIIFATSYGKLIALNLLDGEVKWKKQLDYYRISTQLVLQDNYLYVATLGGKVYCLDLRHGRRNRWNPKKLSGGIDGALTLVRGYLYVGTKKGLLYKINCRTGNIEWSENFPKPILSAPAAVESMLYVGCMDGILYACDINTGQKLWQNKYGMTTKRRGRKIQWGIRSDIIATQETLYLATESGLVYAFENN